MTARVPWRMRSLLAVSFLGFVAATAYCAPGDLYVASDTGEIYRFTSDGQKGTFASGIYQPMAIAFDDAGNLFVANSGNHACFPEDPCPPHPSTIIKITPAGQKSRFVTLENAPFGMAFDGARNLFVSDGDGITKIAPDGTQTLFAQGFEGVWPLVFDRFGNLYAGAENTVLKFAADGSHSTFASSAGDYFGALAFDRSGNLFAQCGDSILRITPAGKTTTFAAGSFYLPNSLAFAPDGSLFAGIYTGNFGDPSIVRFTPNGARTTFATGGLGITELAFEPVTEKLRNVSARGRVGNGEDVLIAGFIAGGNALANNGVIVRAIGPSLARAGVASPLADPVLELRDGSGALIASNNDWQDRQKAAIEASGLAPTDPHESAIFATLPAGNYTAVVRGATGGTGVAVVEVYSVAQ